MPAADEVIGRACLMHNMQVVLHVRSNMYGRRRNLHQNLVLKPCLLQGGAGGEAISMGFGCLPEDAPAVLAMFADVIQSPALPLQRIELYKAQVSRNWDDVLVLY